MESHQKITFQLCTCLHSVFACVVSMNTWLTSHGNYRGALRELLLSHHYRRPLSELFYQFVCRPTSKLYINITADFSVINNKLWLVVSQTDGLVQVSVIFSVLSMTIPRLAFYNTLRPSQNGRRLTISKKIHICICMYISQLTKATNIHVSHCIYMCMNAQHVLL